MNLIRPFRTLPSTLAAGLLLGLALAAPGRAAADEFSPAQQSAIESIVRNYIVQHPEVLQEAMSELDRREKAAEAAKRDKVIANRSGDIFDAPDAMVFGNPQGKVTLVEYFDYNCVYCKRTLDELTKLIKSEPDLRLVIKDFPILRPESIEAAHIAGAARLQLKGDALWQFHSRLLSSRGVVGKAQAIAIAKDLGADPDQLAKDAATIEERSRIKTTMTVADELGLTGTPSFVLGRSVMVGAADYDQIKDWIDNVRKCGKAMCS